MTGPRASPHGSEAASRAGPARTPFSEKEKPARPALGSSGAALPWGRGTTNKLLQPPLAVLKGTHVSFWVFSTDVKGHQTAPPHSAVVGTAGSPVGWEALMEGRKPHVKTTRVGPGPTCLLCSGPSACPLLPVGQTLPCAQMQLCSHLQGTGEQAPGPRHATKHATAFRLCALL